MNAIRLQNDVYFIWQMEDEWIANFVVGVEMGENAISLSDHLDVAMMFMDVRCTCTVHMYRPLRLYGKINNRKCEMRRILHYSIAKFDKTLQR